MSNPILAQVIVDVAGGQLGDRLFSYVVPDHLAAAVKIGSMVTVPFGRMSPRRACVVTVDAENNNAAVVPEKLKEILDVVGSRQLFDKEYFEFLQAVADYYMAPLSSVIAATLPPKVNMKTKQIKTVVLEDGAARTPRQENIADVLKHAGGQMSLPELLAATGTTRSTVTRMEKEGVVTVVEHESLRDPLTQYGLADAGGAAVVPPPVVLPELTPDQQKVFSVLDDALQEILSVENNAREDRGGAVGAKKIDLPQQRCVAQLTRSPADRRFFSAPQSPRTCTGRITAQPWLIHGVTGSGKTEIYLRLIARTLAAGRTALLMVPEISLTPQLAQRLKERFGNLVSVWHSGLSAGERYDTWCRLGSGQIKVLLGARSAIFVDMPKLGLIVLDEEHDASYKQTSPVPRYNARHVAAERAARCGAMVVLGSATPDMASLYEARAHEHLLELPRRVAEQPMPQVEIVDMRMEFQQGHQGDFSWRLQEEISACLSRSEQVILLMNRRGFAQHVFCKACGYTAKCRHCSVSLVLHQHANTGFLACHHCGYRTPFVSACPGCSEWHLEAYGLGTQKVEHELSKLFPSARVLRLDGDVTAKRGAYQAVLSRFAEGGADILVGTQLVAKGLDIHNVTLVGVLAADAAFNLPDYRSSERGFQLLMQVAGRAGRGSAPGKVILQTYSTELPALNLAQQHDYESFASAELLSRKELEYPPYSQLIRAVVSGSELIEVQAFCEQLAEDLSRFLDEAGETRIKILGPAPCVLERIKGSYRYHLLVKNMIGEAGRKLIASFLQPRRVGSGLLMAVDIDAVDLL